MRQLLIVGTLLAFLNLCRAIGPIFTDDFDRSVSNWWLDKPAWQWSGDPQTTPDTTKIPSFSSDGNFVWTNRSVNGNWSVANNSISLRGIEGVTKATKIHIRYWFYTSNRPNDQPYGLNVYLFYNDHNREDGWAPVVKIQSNSDKWNDVIIDCNHHQCCYTDECTLIIKIIASVGVSDGDGFAAIRCVSTADNGCDPRPKSLPAVTTPPSDDEEITVKQRKRTNPRLFKEN